MSRTYCHTHSKYDCPTCADEILSLGIQADKDRIKWLESEVARLEACAAQSEPEEKLDFEKLESLGWQIAICAMCGTHASAIKPVQSVAVVGEPVAWGVKKRYEDNVWFISDSRFTAQHYANQYAHRIGAEPDQVVVPLYAAPTHSIPAVELATLRKKAARLDALEHTLRHLGRELAKLDKYRLCMSYNDSYFGEPSGTVKRVVVELRHCIDAAIAQGKGE